VQGQLRGETVSVMVETECAHCSAPMHIEIDSRLEYGVREQGADPIVFVPQVDLYAIEDPSIIDRF
jgi:hypothetical protein